MCVCALSHLPNLQGNKLLLPYMCTCIHTHTRIHTHTHTQANMHKCMHARPPTLVHTCTHTCTNTHINMHTHRYMLIMFQGYLHEVVGGFIGIGPRVRSDMLIHHFATMTLISSAYLLNLSRMGIMWQASSPPTCISLTTLCTCDVKLCAPFKPATSCG